MRTVTRPPTNGALWRQPPGHPRHHARVALPAADVGAREALRGVEWVIVDEIMRSLPPSAAHTWRSRSNGSRNLRAATAAHRLIGTQRPLSRWPVPGRPCPRRLARPSNRDAGKRKPLDLKVVVRLRTWAAIGEGAARRTSSRAGPPPTPIPGARSGRPSIPKILELVQSHRSTIVFVNSRRLGRAPGPTTE
jgi:ATP-dependent Lhr-like helicase